MESQEPKYNCAHTELMDLHKLVDNPRNPNQHTDQQIECLAKIIDYQGQRSPIVISSSSGFITKGHGRLAALKLLGWDQAAVDFQHYDNDAQEYADMVADNKIAELAKSDDAMILADMKDFAIEDFDLLGMPEFEPEELPPEGKTDANSVPDIQDPVTKKGDVWMLGNHRLMCGSSTVITDVDKLLAGQNPNTMITDPPYGVNYKAGWRAEAKGTAKTAREETSSIDNDDQADWYDAYALHRGNVAYVWHASSKTDIVKTGLENAGFEIKAQIIWNKNVHALSRSDYHWKHEPCWYAVKKGAKHNWVGDRKQMTVWDVDNVIFEKDAGGKTSHPTQKPVELYEKTIYNHTNEGEYIYEPFAGSGSSIIAAERTSRRSLSMELDPKFCDVIVRRWQEYTGETAYLESNNYSYDSMKSERIPR